MTAIAWKRLCAISVLVAVGFVVTTSGGADDPQPEGSTSEKARIAELEQKIELLESRIAALERGSVEPVAPRFVMPPLPPVNPHATSPFFVQPQPKLSTPPNLPRGAVPREFNGSPYYIIPLDDADRKAE